MKFFQNRAVAAVIAVIAVCGSLLLNTKLKLGEQCDEVRDSFFETVKSGEKSPAYYLDARLDAANGLWTLVKDSSPAEADELATARQMLLYSIDDRDVSDMYDANEALQEAFDAASAKAGQSNALTSYEDAFSGAQKMIGQSDYNNKVMELERQTLDKFPANMLAPMVGVGSPELFE